MALEKGRLNATVKAIGFFVADSNIRGFQNRELRVR